MATTWQERNAEVNKRYTGRVMSPEETRREMAYIFPSGLNIPRIADLSGVDLSPANILRQAQQSAGVAQQTTPTAPAPGTTEPVVDEATLKKQQLAASLSQALRNQGVNWNYTVGQPYAPPSSMLGGQPWSRVKNMPTLYQLLLAAASASGRDPADYMAEVQAFQHQGPQYSTVSYR